MGEDLGLINCLPIKSAVTAVSTKEILKEN